MSAESAITAAIGLALIALMIFLVARFAPRRHFPGWQYMLVVVLLLAVGLMIALSVGGGSGVRKP